MTRILRGDHCRCSACGEYFNSAAAFDRHRVGAFSHGSARRCLTVLEMAAKGIERNAGGFWLCGARWKGPSLPPSDAVLAAIGFEASL